MKLRIPLSEEVVMARLKSGTFVPFPSGVWRSSGVHAHQEFRGAGDERIGTNARN